MGPACQVTELESPTVAQDGRFAIFGEMYSTHGGVMSVGSSVFEMPAGH